MSLEEGALPPLRPISSSASPSQRFTDRVCVVTGAGQGIGRATAERFASEGASVVVADLNPETGEEAAREMNRDGRQVVFVEVDVTSEASVCDMVEQTVASFGRLDYLVNNAGIYPVLGGAVETSVEDWDATLDVSLRGTFLCTKFAVPRMSEHHGGAIVNVSSTFAIAADQGSAAYTAAKAGIIGFTKSCAVDYGHLNIRSNCVCPGGIMTEGVASRNAQAPDKNYWSYYSGGAFSTFDVDRSYSEEEVHFIRENRWKAKLLGRGATPFELASVIAFLASEDASWITGATIPVDGGETSVLASSVIRNLTATGAY